MGLWDFGSPWLLMDPPKAWRADIHDVPLSGLGQLWVQKSGQRLVLMWPVAACTTRDCHAAMTWSWLSRPGDGSVEFPPMTSAEFCHFADNWISTAVLSPDCMLWIPLG